MLDKTLIDEFKTQKILPVFNTSELMLDVARLEIYLTNNPEIKNVEITLREKDSFKIAKELKKKFVHINFGLGSILSERDYLEGKDNGFVFFVSPGIVIDLLKAKATNYIPGGETISEFMFIINNGYKVIKFFPSNLAGGEKKLISVKNILKEAMFIPTGGINMENYIDFISLNNVLCVGMSNFDK